MKTIGKWKAIASTAHSGRVPMIVSAVAALFMASSIMCGCGGSDDASEAPSEGSSNSASAARAKKSKARKAPPKDALVVKGLYMGMPGDDAVEACREIVGDSNDLVVVDLRNGIEREKDEATKEKDRKNWEDTVKLAEADFATLESNHDPVLLRQSGRHPSLIQRIAGPRGHLSNDQACGLVRRFASPKLKSLALAHLSRDCNVPRMAEEAMRATLLEMGRPDVSLKVLCQDESVEL